MPVMLHWGDIALRLALTLVAGVLIGYNRSEHGKVAGMSTTVLVCLAASVTMIQVNLLLPMAGRTPDSFVMNDLMRFPLGILTGVGFIGAGAILRRDAIVVGVTTAATLWLVTVIGLCLGSGLLALGMAATLLGLGALWGLKWLEAWLRREHRARLSLELDASGPGEAEIRRRLKRAGLKIAAGGFVIENGGGRRSLVLNLSELRRPAENDGPRVVDELASEPGVVRARWEELL
jgi:putative Mg2+ transporter-C (MgtC) family protein